MKAALETLLDLASVVLEALERVDRRRVDDGAVANVRIVRDGTVVYTTTIDSLKRFQDDAREVQEGFECGLHLANFDDVKVGDVLEVFETREVERTSLDEPAPAPAATT